jgi:hypothetical protein
VHSKVKLESGLSVAYRNATFANVKSIFAVWNLVKEHPFRSAETNGNSTNITILNLGVIRTLF